MPPITIAEFLVPFGLSPKLNVILGINISRLKNLTPATLVERGTAEVTDTLLDGSIQLVIPIMQKKGMTVINKRLVDTISGIIPSDGDTIPFLKGMLESIETLGDASPFVTQVLNALI